MKNQFILAAAGGVLTLAFMIGVMTFAPKAVSGGDAQVLVVNFERIPYDIETWSTIYDVIAIGKIVSVEAKVLDESYNSTNTYTGEPLHYEIKTPYNFVTIEVEKYLKDMTNASATQITFRDETDGEVSLGGVTTYVRIEDGGAEYSVGDRAVFFMSQIDGGFTCDGYMSKFDIDASNNALSKHLSEKGENAIPLSIFEDQVVGTVKSTSG